MGRERDRVAGTCQHHGSCRPVDDAVADGERQRLRDHARDRHDARNRNHHARDRHDARNQPPRPAPAPRPEPEPPRPTPAPRPARNHPRTPKSGSGSPSSCRISSSRSSRRSEFSYTRTEAIKQRHNPLGAIEHVASDIGPGHFFEVDLDDPFFRTIPIVVAAPGDFQQIGMQRIDARLTYGRASDPAGVKEKNFTFARTTRASSGYSFSLNQAPRPRLRGAGRLQLRPAVRLARPARHLPAARRDDAGPHVDDQPVRPFRVP